MTRLGHSVKKMTLSTRYTAACVGILALLGAGPACSDDETGGAGGRSGTGGKAGTGGSGGKSGSAGTGGTTTGGSGGGSGSGGTMGSGGAGGKSGSGGTAGGSGGSGGVAGASGGAAGAGGSAGGDASAGAAGADSGTDGSADASSLPNIRLENHASLGAVLSNGNGRSLYFYAKDLPGDGTNDPAGRCTDTCLTTWPVFYASPRVLGSGLSAGSFSEFTRADGAKQTTYNGWPLYRNVSDSAPGQTTGDGMNKMWHAVKVPFYSIVIMHKDMGVDGGAAPGSYVADATGRTFYSYLSDTPGTTDTDPVSTCTTSVCLTNWPPVDVNPVSVVSSLNPTDFKRYTRPAAEAGTLEQLAYKGMPLHRRSKDLKPGDTVGQGTLGLWFVAAP